LEEFTALTFVSTPPQTEYSKLEHRCKDLPSTSCSMPTPDRL
jgi:hypothetical protein